MKNIRKIVKSEKDKVVLRKSTKALVFQILGIIEEVSLLLQTGQLNKKDGQEVIEGVRALVEYMLRVWVIEAESYIKNEPAE